jgi:hypothetical protein
MFGSSHQMMWPAARDVTDAATTEAENWVQAHVNAHWGGTEILGALKAVFAVPISEGEPAGCSFVRHPDVGRARLALGWLCRHTSKAAVSIIMLCMARYAFASEMCSRACPPCAYLCLVCKCAGPQREIIFCTDGGVSSTEEGRIKALVQTSRNGSLTPIKKVQLSACGWPCCIMSCRSPQSVLSCTTACT